MKVASSTTICAAPPSAESPSLDRLDPGQSLERGRVALEPLAASIAEPRRWTCSGSLRARAAR